MSSLYFKERFNHIQANVEKYVHGKPDVVRLALTCFFAEGHLLIEDVPGVAKTLLAKAIAGSIKDVAFHVSSSRRTCCPPISPGWRSSIHAPVSSPFDLDRSSPTS